MRLIVAPDPRGVTQFSRTLAIREGRVDERIPGSLRMPDTTADQRELQELIAKASQGGLPTRPQEPEEPPESRRRKVTFLTFLMVLLVGTTAWVSIEANREPNPFTPAREEMGLRAMMYITIETLEGHREATGSYPGDLLAVDSEEEGLTYKRLGDGYELIGRLPHRNVEIAFRPGDDLTPYEIALDRASRRSDET
jgi:hypothetical protein